VEPRWRLPLPGRPGRAWSRQIISTNQKEKSMLPSKRRKAGSGLGIIAITMAGVAMTVFAWTCFRDVPFIGTVFLVPGESILHARKADPILRYVLLMAGCLFTAFGLQMQIIRWYHHSLIRK
jgi:hypothetical protein